MTLFLNYKCSYYNYSSNLAKHEKIRTFNSKNEKKTNVSSVMKCFIHTMNYLNVKGHVENVYVSM